VKRLPTLSAAPLVLLGLAALLVFGNCSQNVYRVLGPGTTAQQVRQLKLLNDSVQVHYRAARLRPATAVGPTPEQIIDSAETARRRLLTPAQYERLTKSARQSILPLRYPRRPPRDYR
jgi:hypothetical protein